MLPTVPIKRDGHLDTFRERHPYEMTSLFHQGVCGEIKPEPEGV
jgi:hypothetical protein